LTLLTALLRDEPIRPIKGASPPHPPRKRLKEKVFTPNDNISLIYKEDAFRLNKGCGPWIKIK